MTGTVKKLENEIAKTERSQLIVNETTAFILLICITVCGHLEIMVLLFLIKKTRLILKGSAILTSSIIHVGFSEL